MFVVINAYPRSTVAPEEIRRSVIEIHRVQPAGRPRSEKSGNCGETWETPASGFFKILRKPVLAHCS